MINNLSPHTTAGAQIEHIKNGIRLAIPNGSNRQYRVAQLDDYAKSVRKYFPHRPSLNLSLHARASKNSLPGTWGFGMWNDPFGLSLGFGGNPLRLPALPNALWFFHASSENYLSFRETPGNGFLAQVFCSPKLPMGQLAKAGLTLPFSRIKTRSIMAQIVEEEGVRLGIDTTKWHAYRLEWSLKRSTFWVDDTLVFESSVSPRPPLGVVIWIDNQYAAFTPEGKIGFGVLENIEPAWLEIKNISLR